MIISPLRFSQVDYNPSIVVSFNASGFVFSLSLSFCFTFSGCQPSLYSSLLLHTFCDHWTTVPVMRMKMHYDRQNIFVCHRYLRDGTGRIKRGGVTGCIMAALHLLIILFYHLPVFSETKRPKTESIFCLRDLLSQPETNLISQLSLLVAAALCY